MVEVGRPNSACLLNHLASGDPDEYGLVCLLYSGSVDSSLDSSLKLIVLLIVKQYLSILGDRFLRFYWSDFTHFLTR